MVRVMPGLALALAAAACGEAGPPDRAGSTGAGAAPVAAAALLGRYAGLTGADRLATFADGVAVVGTVTEVADHGDDGGGLVVRLAAEPGSLSLRFDDGGAAVRPVAAGAELTARCRLDGLVDGVLHLAGCVAAAR